MTMNATRPDAASSLSRAPLGTDGRPAQPEPHFDAWDETPHAYFTVPIAQVQLADVVFGGTHQVDGIGQANQRGAEARRFDLAYVVGPSEQPTARVILPLDQMIEVKRYLPAPGHRWARVELKPEYNDNDHPAGLIPDYQANVQLCCGLLAGVEQPHGYDEGQTMCDDCVDSWSTDYLIARH